MKRMLLVLATLWLSACSRDPSSALRDEYLIDHGHYQVDISHPSQSQNERVRFLVFHYTAVEDAESLRLLTRGKASAHYLIPSIPATIHHKPVVFQLVSENKRAWHAGFSDWRGRSNLNDTSIGIEIVNDGFHEDLLGKKWIPYHPEQLELLTRLARDIIDRYQIEPENVIGHSDIAPLRKFDPGPLFPWERLAKLGIGAWPDPQTVREYLAGHHPWSPGNVRVIQQALAAYGYTLPQTGEKDPETLKVISAFQMHFRPSNFSGVPDKQTEAIARALVTKYRTKV